MAIQKDDIDRKKSTHRPSEIPERQAEDYISAYANLIEISATPWDFRVRFYEVVEDEDGNQVREKKVAVTISPQSTQAFIGLLNQGFREWIADQQNTDDDEEDS